MRIWSLHPQYLDARGLVTLWREALLAQAVLRGETKGYKHHPQLLRFKEQASPAGMIAAYLRELHAESLRRGYNFDAKKIGRARVSGRIAISRGQLEFEWQHLLRKVKLSDPKWHARIAGVKNPKPHPLFRIVRGDVAPWEKGAG